MDATETATASETQSEAAGGTKEHVETATAVEMAAPTASGTESTTTTETKPAAGEAAATEAAAEPAAPGNEAVGVEGYDAMLKAALAKSAEAKKAKDDKAWESAKATAKADEAVSEAARTGSTASAGTVADATDTGYRIPETGEEETAVTTPDAATTEAPVTTPEEKATPGRIRVKGVKDGHYLALANELAREEGISVIDAFARVTPKKELPPETAAATTSEAVDARTPATIQTELDAVDAEMETAGAGLDTATMTKLVKKSRELTRELDKAERAVERAEEQRASSEQRQFTDTVNVSKAKAVANWPEAADENSSFSKRMIELADQYEADPNLAHHVSEADAPFFFADMVAKEQGLLPKHLRKAPATNGATAAAAATSTGATPASTSTATRPAPVNQRAVGRPQPATAATPASGAARTTQGGPKDDLGLDKVHSPHDYEKLMSRIGKPALAQRGR